MHGPVCAYKILPLSPNIYFYTSFDHSAYFKNLKFSPDFVKSLGRTSNISSALSLFSVQAPWRLDQNNGNVFFRVWRVEYIQIYTVLYLPSQWTNPKLKDDTILVLFGMVKLLVKHRKLEMKCKLLPSVLCRWTLYLRALTGQVLEKLLPGWACCYLTALHSQNSLHLYDEYFFLLINNNMIISSFQSLSVCTWLSLSSI
jgi:hypothetical protein